MAYINGKDDFMIVVDAGGAPKYPNGMYIVNYNDSGYITDAIVFGKSFTDELLNELNLKSVVYEEGITEIAVSSCRQSTVEQVTFPNSVEIIGEHAFSECSNLTTANPPDGIKEIRHYAFNECSKWDTPKLPENLEYIGEYAFAYTSLTATEIPAGVKYLGEYCFRDTKMPSLTFKGKPDSIHKSALSWTVSVKVVNVPWSEGEVAGAPWGATDAQINYNYTEGEAE